MVPDPRSAYRFNQLTPIGRRNQLCWALLRAIRWKLSLLRHAVFRSPGDRSESGAASESLRQIGGAADRHPPDDIRHLATKAPQRGELKAMLWCARKSWHDRLVQVQPRLGLASRLETSVARDRSSFTRGPGGASPSHTRGGSRMRESCTWGASSNGCPYRDALRRYHGHAKQPVAGALRQRSGKRRSVVKDEHRHLRELVSVAHGLSSRSHASVLRAATVSCGSGRTV